MGQNLKNLKSRKTSLNPLFSCCCATSGGILDRVVEAEDKKRGDILRLDHFSSRSVPFFSKYQNNTDDLIADNIIDMMIPGEDSVPVLLTLAVKYLSDCPAALQQLLVFGNYGSYLFSKSLAVCMAHDSGILR
ncbi:3-epi-6-deoxocathasterone 23-monooxygenase CYP90D1-like [Humulus lupulus]|uniref:3-epi-6-deoxocathasterone 23-monooxygenase CYP90D1-like n=1 Tax=Humulus lupulus TaxID=3486 RepID=UPI002B411D74|nr:3-epi-6-deoxocathasterone 23-monooxygenase CYP90D1-like [Humulus lupulus]XP_062082600.1 3-epi-6-deoxocathasterone 23-monooxygenase CYP90D1-like [Humulus lupulus]